MSRNKIKDIYKERLLSQKPALQDDDIQLLYILQYLPDDKNIEILDAGCGNGKYAYYLSNLGYKNIYAVDLFEDIQTDRFVYRQASIDNLPFGDDAFDFVYSNSVIYYLDNAEDGIKEFNRVLKKKGMLLFSAHTRYSLFTLWRIFKRDILKLKSMEHLQDVKFYSANYYKNILEKNGFEVVLQTGYESSFFAYPFFQKVAKFFDRFLNIKIPLLKNRSETKSDTIKSEISYHAVFAARKVDG